MSSSGAVSFPHAALTARTHVNRGVVPILHPFSYFHFLPINVHFMAFLVSVNIRYRIADRP